MRQIPANSHLPVQEPCNIGPLGLQFLVLSNGSPGMYYSTSTSRLHVFPDSPAPAKIVSPLRQNFKVNNNVKYSTWLTWLSTWSIVLHWTLLFSGEFMQISQIFPAVKALSVLPIRTGNSQSAAFDPSLAWKYPPECWQGHLATDHQYTVYMTPL